jgi:uncharacterized phiE125 gp8 family phage protein
VILLSLKLITPPTEQPVTLAEVKSHLRIDADITADDEWITNTGIPAAVDIAESYQNRALMTQTWVFGMDHWPKDRFCLTMPLFELPKPPLQSVTSIKYTDKNGVESTIDPSDYLVNTFSLVGIVKLVSGKAWPSVELASTDAIKVEFVCGYKDTASIPAMTKTAIMELVGFLRQNRSGYDKLPDGIIRLLDFNKVISI